MNPGCCCRPDGTPKDWTINYDPVAAGGEGCHRDPRGRIADFGVGNGASEAEGASLDRFGIFNMQDNNGKHSVVYLDNLCYTSARVEMSPVTGVTAQRFGNTIQLNWTNPAATDFMGTTVRFIHRLSTGPTDGTFGGQEQRTGHGGDLWANGPRQRNVLLRPVRSRRGFALCPAGR